MRFLKLMFLAGVLLAAVPALATAQTLETIPFSKKLKLAKVGDEAYRLMGPSRR